MSEQDRRVIREEYLNALNFSNGDIFRHLRYCSLRNEPFGRVKWFSRLSKSKRRDLKQLKRFAEKDIKMERFKNSLNDLIPYTGLWPALKLGTFHRLLPLRCPEELTHYLRKIKETWDFILRDDKDLCLQLNSCTMQSLEGRCPCYSAEDLALAEKRLDRYKIFVSPCFDAQRDQLLQRLREMKHLISSIHTFLENTKYFEPCAKIMKRLLSEKFKRFIRQVFERQHNGQCGFFEQIDEVNTTTEQMLNSSSNARWKSYRQLWLFAWRHFFEIIGIALRKDSQKFKPVKVSIEYSWWYVISVLASQSDYTNISNAFADADEIIARDFLRHARPSQLYHFDDIVFDTNVRRICDVLKQIQLRSIATEASEISSNRDSCGTDVLFRCGRPFEQVFRDDVDHFYLRHLYKDYGNVQRKRYVTSFAVKRDIFYAFFGSPSLGLTVAFEAGPSILLVFTMEQHQQRDNETSSLSDFRNDELVPSQSRSLFFSSGANAEHLLLLDSTEQSRSSLRPFDLLFAATELFVATWNDIILMAQKVSPRDLFFLTFLSPLEQKSFRFQVKQLRRNRNPRKNKHLITELNIRGVGTEHFYMIYNGDSGCKFIYGPSVVGNPKDKVIVGVLMSSVNVLKRFFESKKK